MEKRLIRSKKERLLCGVCGGIAEYFDQDPTIVRLIWIILSLIMGIGVIAYIIAAFIMPSQQTDIVNSIITNENTKFKYCDTEKRRKILGCMLISIGILIYIKRFFELHFILPIVLIIIGSIIIYTSDRKLLSSDKKN